MRLTSYVVHIVAGALGLLSGFVALYATKGAPLHRRAGMVFVYTMVTMCVAGGAIAALWNVVPSLNVPPALLTASLVVTALTTVRPATPTTRRIDGVATLVMLGVGLASLTLGVTTLARGSRSIVLFPYFMFGVISLLAVAGDVRVRRRGPARGAERVARHLWRMSYALFVATMSFFIGQAKVFPPALRIPGLLALPVVAVLVTMLYWLWRVRVRRSLRGMHQLGMAPPSGA
jgi:uncharacterized membrane protein